MIDETLLNAILDSLKAPILFAGTDHVTRYMNRAALSFYEGGAELIGRSLLDCHNEESQQKMKEVLVALQNGQDEQHISEEDGSQIYMRAVRDKDGTVIGYYERYEPVPG